MIKNAKICEEKFSTPVNKVNGSSVPKKNNMDEQCKMDIALSDNYIGKIVNMSQIFNSYLNDAIHRNASEEEITELYNMSSRLSSMSQIEIDRSKKVFDNLNMAKELKLLRSNQYIRRVTEVDENGKEYQKMVVPKFFALVSSADTFREYETFHTPLDMLQEVLKLKQANRVKDKKQKQIKELLIKPSVLGESHQTRSVRAIYDVVLNCGKRINHLKVKDNKLNAKAKDTLTKRYKAQAIEELNKLKPNDATILYVLKQCFEKTGKLDFKKYGMLTLNLLFVSKKRQVLKCFKQNTNNEPVFLIKATEDYDYDLFGEKYKRYDEVSK